MQEYKVSLPKELDDDLSILDQETISVKKEHQRLVIEKKKTPFETQNVSLRWFLLPALMCSVIFFIVFFTWGDKQISMTGDFSIATATMLLGLISGSFSFISIFINRKRKEKNPELSDIQWRNVPTIIGAFIVILMLGILSFFWIIGMMFEGASFDIYTATAIFFIFTAIINYLMIYAAYSFTSSMIVTILIVVIIGGVFFAMLTNSESRWWQHNFSFLGTNEAASSWQFNLTLMLSALLMVALIDYLFVNLKKSGYTGFKVASLRVLLTMVAISLGGVGFFPNNGTGQLHALHTKAAEMLVYLIVILIVSIRWILPKVTKEFLTISYGIAAVLVACNFLFQNIGYLSLTVFELLAFGLALSWILLLLQHIQQLAHLTNAVYEISIEPIKEELAEE
ncbi:DUF998 domain-containing protein [Vagococcus fluvialis]|uniref:DUF998 domain-containing protein n=1 Tax=Vagococcus fluvialis TaxID=2738 RepID=A0A369B555_9ENTE|nr:DUF998 domain-containing protein [Vagococcus fluvialis]MDT2747321.1 DUF998 domain-containing protein [Vagococcus fluvialis]RCX15687.1 putative membrane protein [Vagococcus fluvialis]RSU04420.1 hypothetical protein CBF32_03310 [Vagococcus fluvialis]WNF89102.1 DUF998 domain-containing protein [Vagococcus fluvialis]